MPKGGNTVKYTKSRSRIIIRCVSLVLVACLSVFAATGVRAADAQNASDLSTGVIASLTARNNRLVEYLEKNAVAGNMRTLISDYVRDGAFGLDSDTQTQLAKVLQKGSVASALNTVDLGNGYSLTFFSDGGFSLDELTGKQLNPNDPCITGLVSNPLFTQGQVQYKWASNDFYAYNAFGSLLFHIHIESNFGYDGVTAWYAGGVAGSYERGFLSIWQVSNWEVGTTVIDGGAYCRAYARGNFHWGFEYQGNGIVIQDAYEDVRVSVTRDGTVYRS